ncbi:thermonuclease family protein [Brevundimonas diminuta]|uniref:thermonuclease family protein n=1 Tax=Brevundimonas diminuta TaxID=293 RepID=UPI000B35221D|nr:thermonuclease family protein [Brevundimonas diminuta]
MAKAVIAALALGACGASPVVEARAGAPIVVDGDTLTVEGVRVRLWGVDAPEQDQSCLRDGQAYRCGQVASQALREWIGRRPAVCVEVEKDQYGRSVARCAVDDQDIGAWLVSQGQALDYRRHSGGAYAGEEASARAAARGMHAGTFEPAWDWRAARRNKRPEQAPPRSACAIKGNINAKGARYYHSPGMRSYAKTRIVEAAGERWFCSEAEARAAGWEAPPGNP